MIDLKKMKHALEIATRKAEILARPPLIQTEEERQRERERDLAAERDATLQARLTRGWKG